MNNTRTDIRNLAFKIRNVYITVLFNPNKNVVTVIFGTVHLFGVKFGKMLS